jgi:hypothetical protein
MLKPFDQLFAADEWHSRLPLFGAGADIPRPRSPEDLHAIASRFELSDAVPDGVRNQFDLARNLLLYSWFVYEFSTVAELCGYGSVELALRQRCGAALGKEPSLSRMLRHAMAEGWLRDEGFRSGRERLEEWDQAAEDRAAFEQIGARFVPLDTDPQYYARIICDTLPSFRNYLAHGNPARFRSAISSLEICSELISQLFPNSAGLTLLAGDKGPS